MTEPYPITYSPQCGIQYEYTRRLLTLEDPVDILDLIVRRLYATENVRIAGCYDPGDDGGGSCPIDLDNVRLYVGGDAVINRDTLIRRNLTVQGDFCIEGSLSVNSGGGEGGGVSFGGNVILSGITTSNTLNSTNANITNANITNLTSSRSSFTGISTFINGPVFIGSGTSTGTTSQPLQVSGGAYVSGNTGIGTTNPTSKLHIIGNTLITGISTVGLGTTSAPSNSQLTFELTSDTNLRIKVRGTDGVLRSANITLA
jgi:hypothetical protein